MADPNWANQTTRMGMCAPKFFHKEDTLHEA